MVAVAVLELNLVGKLVVVVGKVQNKVDRVVFDMGCIVAIVRNMGFGKAGCKVDGFAHNYNFFEMDCKIRKYTFFFSFFFSLTACGHFILC